MYLDRFLKQNNTFHTLDTKDVFNIHSHFSNKSFISTEIVG